MKRRICVGLAFAFIAAGQATAQTIGAQVDYKAGSTICQGFLANDLSKQGKRPGILIIHDWNGIDAYEEGRAVQLAKLGYVVLCADIYGKGNRPKNVQENGAFASKYKGDRTLFRERLKGALDELRQEPSVDPNKIVAIGYCFGGTGVLEMARAGMDVRGVASFHGGLDAATGFEAGNVKAKVLICHGADDPFVPAEDVAAFKKEFAAADLDFVAYAGAVHSFTEPKAGNNPKSGAAYNKTADEKSWAKLLDFLSKVLK